MIKYFFPLLLVLFSVQHPVLYSQKAATAVGAAQQAEPGYFLHTVERGQTVYAISVMYSVSVESIYKLNPASKEFIREGDQLKIPQASPKTLFHTIQPKETLYAVSKRYNIKGQDIMDANPGLSPETFAIGKTILIPIYKEESIGVQGKTAADESEFRVNSLLSPPFLSRSKSNKTIDIALLLPFGTVDVASSNRSHTQRFVEYYEGILLAIDSLKREGVSINLQVYDIGYQTGYLEEVLKKNTFSDVQLLIGGVNDEQISVLATFAKKNKIKYVIPFTSKANESLNNPYVFQTNPPQSYLYSGVSAAFTKKHSQSSVVYIDMSDNQDKTEFLDILRTDLQSKNKQPTTLTYNADTFFDELKTLLLADRFTETVLVLSSGSAEAVMRLIFALRQLKETESLDHVKLFGYPEWQTYFKDHLDDYFLFNTSIYSVFFTNNTDAGVKDFYQLYRKWYNKSMINSYPRYAFLGFDTAMYFISLLHQYGVGFEAALPRFTYTSLQTGFNFTRTNNWGGFVNTNVYWINFSSDYTIQRLSVK